MKTNKTEQINEFKKRFDLSDEDWNKFLEEYTQGENLQELCKAYQIKYDAFRYLSYSLGLVNRKNERAESVLLLQKDLARESGEDFDVIHEMEKELESVTKKNRQLLRSINLTRDENNNLRKIVRVEDRASNFEERILENLRNELHSISFNKLDIKYQGLPKPTQEYGNVLLLGDAHFGCIEEEDVSGNVYNHDVAHRRMLYVVDKVLEYPIRSENLIIFELLDILKGLIHNSEYLSEEGITGSMLKVVEVYTDILDRLSPAYKNIDIYVTNSNHDRTTPKPTSVIKWDNFGIMLMKMLEQIIKAKGITNINFHFTKCEHHLVNINGAEVFATHGDSIRQYQAYSKAQRNHVQSLSLGLFKKPYKHMVSGHTHASMAVSNEYGGYNIVNGTLVGNAEYGVVNGFSSIEAVQTFFNIDDKGDIENINFINLSHIV